MPDAPMATLESLVCAPRITAIIGGLLICNLSLGCSAKDGDSAGASDDWLAATQDLGSPRTGAPDADLSDTSMLWFLSSHFVPGIDWDDPTIDIPLFLFDTVAMDPGVANPGSCPYQQLDGNQTTWRSDCRSTQGYEWQGSLVQTRWSDGGFEYSRWDSDIVIVPGVEDPEFDRLSIQGSFVYVRGDDVVLERATQGNIEIALDGYWERASMNDPREAAWSRWAWTGREEQRPGGRHRIEGIAELAGVGTVSVTATDLVVSSECTQSPTGTVVLAGNQSVSLGFHGETDCRRCADIEGAGDTTEACQ